MKNVISLCTLIVASICMVSAQAPQEERQLFADKGFQTRLDKAKSLNHTHRYQEAYEYLDSLQKDLLSTISLSGHDAGDLPCTADFIFYQNVLVSKAECAYMLHLWKEMLPICNEQIKAINDRYLSNLGTNKDYYFQVGSFYKIRGDYYYLIHPSNLSYLDEATESYEKALEFFSKAGDRQAMSKVYAEMAQVAYAQNRFDEAQDHLQFALNHLDLRPQQGSNASADAYEDETPSLYMNYRLGLAMCLAQQGKYERALEIVDDEMQYLAPDDDWMPEVKRRKAKILMWQHAADDTHSKEVADLYADYFKAVKREVAEQFLQMTADQREEYWMHKRPFVADCYQLENRNPEMLYNVTLYNKGMLLEMARSFEDMLKPEEKASLQQLRQEDAHNAIGAWNTSYAVDYEKRLLQAMRRDGRSKKFFTPLSHTWKEVQKALPQDGCAIEFVAYEKNASTHFAALVLKKKGTPQFVHLCDANLLGDQPIYVWYTLKDILETTQSSWKDFIYDNKDIGQYIWTPQLIDAIGSSQKVYFSVDGYLHQLAIEYLLPEALKAKKLYRLSSTRVLVDGHRVDARKIREGAAFVLGGIVYDSYSDTNSHADPGNDAEAFTSMQKMGVTFSYMQGARVECDSIIYYRHNPRDLYLYGLNATERAFYEHCNEYPLLHLSTHGFFSGNTTVGEGLLASASKDALSQSILALSNAGTHLRDEDFDAFNKDGLLSAREISRLNLKNVELVTTSACQTGLGYITADGIYGLERGFKSAGAKGMVVTLWSVGIESARIFFTSLYKYMQEGESVHTAFHHARNDLMTKSFTTTSGIASFSRSALSSKAPFLVTDQVYNTPQHTCPYLLIDVWE